ncbi:hypothetical protein Tco_1251607 [Tanacetum coccineum]
MLCQWRVRKKGQEANPYEDYREFPSVFCLKINHGGTFTPPPMTRYKGGKGSDSDEGLWRICIKDSCRMNRQYSGEFPSVFCLKINHGGTFTPPPMTRYKGGKVNWVDDIDSDTFSIVEVTSMLQELGYENPCMAYYYKKPNSELENGLVELVVDKDVYEMLMYVDKFKVIELYTDHTVKKQHVLTQEPLATIIDVTQPDSSSGNEAEVDVSEDEWLGRAKSNILLNNLCEVLNRQLLDGRDKPIITCLEYIREYLMKRIVNVQKVQDKCDGPLTPSTAKIFKLIVRAAAKLKVSI